MSQRICLSCQNAIDAGEAVCPLCGEKQTFEAFAPQLPWNLIVGAVLVVAVAVIAGGGWASAISAKGDMENAQSADEEPTNAIMSAEDANRETARIRRRLASELSEWDRMADFRGARMKTNGVLELTARVKDDNTGRRVATFVSSQVQSAVGGRFTVRGLAVNASNGRRLFYRPWAEPIVSKK